MDTDSIQHMSRQEKLQTMESLWDALIQDASELVAPAWHGDLLTERRTKIEQGAAKFVSLDELKSERHQ